MKGTIDASIPQAEELILKSEKEKAEHATIVDLIRNDLSIRSFNVKATRFRYAEIINSGKDSLIQVSSEVSGELKENYYNSLGNAIFDLLPAGSVTGAPKPKTIEVILDAENYDRGYYTGIAGYFDGKDLDSFVLIRFIERDSTGEFWYKSGGGITHLSNAEDEYNELLKKIYVPVY